jgi:hypothetical protein
MALLGINPVAAPTPEPKEREKSDFEKLMMGLQAAQSAFGIYSDYTNIQNNRDLAEQRKMQLEQGKMQLEEGQAQEFETRTAQTGGLTSTGAQAQGYVPVPEGLQPRFGQGAIDPATGFSRAGETQPVGVEMDITTREGGGEVTRPQQMIHQDMLKQLSAMPPEQQAEFLSGQGHAGGKKAAYFDEEGFQRIGTQTKDGSIIKNPKTDDYGEDRFAKEASRIKSLATEYNNRPTTKGTKATIKAYHALNSLLSKAGGKSAIKDVAIIKMLEKFLDPNSVVRQAEAQAIQGTSGAWEQLLGQINKLKGQEFIGETTKAGIRNIMGQILNVSLAVQSQEVDSEFTQRAQAQGVDPARFLVRQQPTENVIDIDIMEKKERVGIDGLSDSELIQYERTLDLINGEQSK